MITRLLTLRPIIRKLADETLVFADWDGFSEAALPGDAPAGFLRWVSRIVMETGLVDWLWLVPFAILAAALSLTAVCFVPRRWRKWPAFLAAGVVSVLFLFLPVMGVGAGVWLVGEPSYPVMNPLGILVAAWIFLALARLPAARKPLFFAALSVPVAALVVPFGAYPLAALAAAAVFHAVKGEGALRRRIASSVFAVALAASAIPLAARFVYDDYSVKLAFDKSHAFFVPWNSVVDISVQLEQEAAIKEGDFAKVLAMADRQFASARTPLRMSVAYRILAQYRLGRLPDELFKYPMPTSHIDTDAEELMMDGYVLLFNYGLVMPARREIYEIASVRGSQPCHFRILGDIAAICGELQLALRYYRELARCPFRGEFARRRIKAVEESDGSAFADIADIADMHNTWKEFYKTQPNVYFNTDQNVEKFVYTHFRALKSAPEAMVRMYVATTLLECDIKSLLDNQGLLDKIAATSAAMKGLPATDGGPWPDPVQEAVLMFINEIPDVAKKQAAAQSIRQNAISAETVARFNAFMSTPQTASLSNPFATTYLFYRAFLFPAGGEPDAKKEEGAK